MAVVAPPPKKPPAPPQAVRVLGAQRAYFRDFYHGFLRMPWWAALSSIVVVYLALNALFAAAYCAVGGIAHANTHAFSDSFFFSVQTMGTIGYGAMYPTTVSANVLVVAESVTGLVVTALATGLIFAKFSQSNARIVFSEHAVIGPMDGVPTLMLRLGNQRSNQIVEAQIRIVLIRTETTKEGATFYRMYDLPPTRERSPAFSRSWSVMHSILPGSMLHGETPESLKEKEIELVVTVVGIDDTSLQPVHARHRYADDEIVWGARHADILSFEADGTLVLDLHKFHRLEPTTPTEDFQYPRG